jgi:hypothetical protein
MTPASAGPSGEPRSPLAPSTRPAEPSDRVAPSLESWTVASPGPPGGPELGGAQCHVESFQQYQALVLQFEPGAG